MLHAIIMAGGAGTRFWPASRKLEPKQLLRLAGERTMIQSTVDRLAGLVPAENVLIVTNHQLVEAIAAQLPQVPAEGILGEPCKRDTAPCIGLAALQVARDDPDAVMAVMPSDHVIPTPEAFRAAIGQAAALVEAAPDRIVTFGIRPTYPAEIFGYIQRGTALTVADGDAPAFAVAQFREKPDAVTAQEYLDSGDFYWNAGIFVWKAAKILKELEQRQPEMFAHLQAIEAAAGSDRYADVLRNEFTAIDGVSIDYAVMEHATDVVVIEAPFEWDDVGNWPSLERLRGVDASNNTVDAKHLGIDTSGCIIRGTDDHLITTLGVSDCIIVQTPDATLVADRRSEESIRQLVKLIEERGWQEYL
ncbi:MAG: mannose-1-phosphate guanylyltransferase [Planctomycetota bacterium]|nr:MAG: mannose-1-phosphate guanylyltransferase [Planctomycetota bacterium]